MNIQRCLQLLRQCFGLALLTQQLLVQHEHFMLQVLGSCCLPPDCQQLCSQGAHFGLHQSELCQPVLAYRFPSLKKGGMSNVALFSLHVQQCMEILSLLGHLLRYIYDCIAWG